MSPSCARVPIIYDDVGFRKQNIYTYELFEINDIYSLRVFTILNLYIKNWSQTWRKENLKLSTRFKIYSCKVLIITGKNNTIIKKASLYKCSYVNN